MDQQLGARRGFTFITKYSYDSASGDEVDLQDYTLVNTCTVRRFEIRYKPSSQCIWYLL